MDEGEIADHHGNGQREGPSAHLSRDLGLLDITLIGVGAMIGAGIFVLTGLAAGAAGPALILAFVLNCGLTLLTAMVYAELGSAIPEAGGGYLWVKEGLPGGNAFMAGWMSWFAHAVAGSLYALGFGAYLTMALNEMGLLPHGLPDWLLPRVLALGIGLVFIAINYRGASETGLVGNLVTGAKLLILLLFIGFGMAHIFIHPHLLHHFTPFAPHGMTGVFSAMGLTFVAFEGYEIIVQAGEEVRDPRRNVPKAIFWSLAIVVPIYILVAFTAIGASTPPAGQTTWQWLAGNSETSLVVAARQFMPLGGMAMLAAGLLSTMSALNATTFSSTRVAFAMGRDRNLPNAFVRIHPRNRTPVGALAASGAIILVMAVAVPIRHVAAAADIMFLLLFLQVNVAVITLRKKYGGKLNYGYLLPLFPLVPILGVLTKFFLAIFMFHYSPLAWYVTAGWLAAGWVVWRFYARPREESKHATRAFVRRWTASKKERYRVLALVANPETLEGIMHVAVRLARVRDGEVIVLRTLFVPRQLPPSGARFLARKARPLLDRAVQAAHARGVPASSLLRVSHAHEWAAAMDTVEECKIDLLVMGWSGRSSPRRRLLGRSVNELILHANCEMVVLHDPPDHPVKRVLIAAAQLRQSDLMLRVARVCAAADGTIDLLHLTGLREDREGLQKVREKFEQQANRARRADPAGPDIRVLVEQIADNRIEKIIARSGDYDLLIIGPAQDSRWRHRLFGTGAERIARSDGYALSLVQPQHNPMAHGLEEFFEFFHKLEEKAAKEADASAAKGVPEGESGEREHRQAERAIGDEIEEKSS